MRSHSLLLSFRLSHHHHHHHHRETNIKRTHTDGTDDDDKYSKKRPMEQESWNSEGRIRENIFERKKKLYMNLTNGKGMTEWK